MDDLTSDSFYPTPWHMMDMVSNVEHRQLTNDTHQLRSPSHIVTITTEGFALYREGDLSSTSRWHKYLESNNIQSVPRDDI